TVAAIRARPALRHPLQQRGAGGRRIDPVRGASLRPGRLEIGREPALPAAAPVRQLNPLQWETAVQRAGASSTTSCSQPLAARTAMVPPMQARDSPSRRALVGPGRLTGSSTGGKLAFGVPASPATPALPATAGAAAPVADPSSASVPSAAASALASCRPADSLPPENTAHNPLATSMPNATASAMGKKNDHGLNARNS